MSTLLTKTTRRGKTIVVTLAQEDEEDRISITIDGEPVELDDEASAGRPVELGPKIEKNMGLEPGAVSFGTTVLTGKEYQEMNQAWSEQSPKYRARHETIEEEKKQVQAQRSVLQESLRAVTAQREKLPDTSEDEAQEESHAARLAELDSGIDRAAAALRQFDAAQKAE